MGYHRLTQHERYQIEALCSTGISLRRIAAVLRRNVSTISRELKRFEPKAYNAYRADKISQKFLQAPHFSRRKIVLEVERYVKSKILIDWSPEQIAGRIAYENGAVPVSYQTIYRYVKRDKKEKGQLWRHLRSLRKERAYRKYPVGVNNHAVVGRTMINERPKIAEKRVRLGDYERDLVLGKIGKGVLLTMVDRTSRLVKIERLKEKDSALVHKATIRRLKTEPLFSITNDNGSEFSLHTKTSRNLKVPIFFSIAAKSGQTASNENMNGLIRQYFPKRKDIEHQHWRKIRAVEDKINNRPRKLFGYKTPTEVHTELKSGVLR
jgi:IS30 family transposase